uniref:B-related factor 1 n=1 Tax=Plectus sambesii TaxID=2011161 RepID=A0A914WTK0_9BILA
MVKTCPHCGCTDIDEDAARGDATCTGCGTVLEENTIVSDIQFAETGGGGHALIGQFVSSDGAQPSSLAGVRGLGAQESREVTLQKGKRVIQEVASQLRINQHCMDTALNFFKMSVSRGLTRGRVRTHVVTACLYMTCRIENTSHLLLDFSDVTQVNVYDLGKTFSFLARALKINLPPTDPCMYVMRFASMLKFGEKEKDVVTLATRLVQRMKRDWLATGRRPTGVCGAALLLAARSANFNRTVADIVRVVHVGEAVVRKRLEEFGQTPSSSLTLDEFATVDLERDEDPPAFREARLRARLLQQQQEDLRLDQLQQQIEPLESEVQRALDEKRRERFKRGPYAKLAVDDTFAAVDPELAVADEIVRDLILDDVDQDGEPEEPPTPSYNDYRPTLESLGIRSPADASHMTALVDTEPLNEDGELDLSGIDDDEIESYILSPPESALKTKVWMKNNASHLQVMEERQRLRREQEEKDKNDPQKRKKVKRRVKKEPIVAATAAEAMEKVIQEKKLSNKINYDVLKFLSGPRDKISEEPSVTHSSLDQVSGPPESKAPKSPSKNPGATLHKVPQPTTRRRSIKPVVNCAVAAKRAKKA